MSNYTKLFRSSNELVRDALRAYIDTLYESGYLPPTFQVNREVKVLYFRLPNIFRKRLNALVRNGHEMSRSAIIRNALVPYKTGKYEEIDIKRLSKKDYSICTTKIPVGTLNMLHKIASSTGNTLTDIALDALRKYLSRFCMELKNKYTLKKKMQLSLPLNLFEEVENAVRGGCFLNRCDMIREALYNYLFEDKVLDRIVANL